MHRIRIWLEWVSAPLFALLVVHMAGHGVMELLHPAGHEEPSAPDWGWLLSPELWVGVGALVLFVWLWHRPQLERLVPCRHMGCRHQSVWPHVLAMGAFVLHFFPEAVLRGELLMADGGLVGTTGVLAFGAHFIIDVVVGITLSLYWPHTWQRVLSFLGIGLLWGGAFFLAWGGGETFSPSGWMSVVGAFFLAMFVHGPHWRG